MHEKRSETLIVRLPPGLKAALRDAAALDHRSLSNLVEHLIATHCAAAGISVPALRRRKPPATK